MPLYWLRFTGIFFTVLISFTAMSETLTHIIGNRANSTEFNDMIKTFYCPSCLFVRNESKEFSNSNTFVRLEDPVGGKVVVVSVPALLTPNELMEALIKVRTAFSLGARSVSAFFEAAPSSTIITPSFGTPLHLDLKKMFAVAGAQTIAYRNSLSGGLSLTALDTLQRPHYLRPTNLHTSIIVDRQHDALAGEVAKKLGLSHVDEAAITNIKGTQIFFFAPSEEPVNANFFAVIERIEGMVQRGAAVVLVSPYLPYARTDKIDQPGVGITGRLVADLIESAGTQAIVFARAHAPQSQGFFAIPSVQIDTIQTIVSAVANLGIEIVVSPDAGFQKDATHFAEALQVPVAVINKRRDPRTGASSIVNITGGSLEGKTVLIVDDETASGGTLAKAADYMVRELGARRVIAAVTHLAGKAQESLSSPYIGTMFVTNSFHSALSVGSVRVLSISEELATGLRPLLWSDRCTTALSPPDPALEKGNPK